jgi:penicillin-binding protein 2
VRSLARTAPVPGNNLVLTLDIKLQQVVERAFGERRGALVAIEPATGGILALVSMPGYDPNLFVDGITRRTGKELNDLRQADGQPRTQRRLPARLDLQALHGAGSAGDRQAHAATDRFPIRATSISAATPSATTRRAATASWTCTSPSSIPATPTTTCWPTTWASTPSRQVHAPARPRPATGIDIEGESEGVLPSQEWKRKRFRKPEQQKWYAGETISIGIGQGYNAYTPIQLAQATATIANNGVLFRPHLVRHIENINTGERVPIEPEAAAHPAAQAGQRRGDPPGHGRREQGRHRRPRLRRGGIQASAGKTGTAQVFSLKGGKYEAGKVSERLRDHALFIAFAPADQPTIALAVLVENGGFGAQSAAPIARQVLDYWLLGKLPKDAAPEFEEEVEGD